MSKSSKGALYTTAALEATHPPTNVDYVFLLYQLWHKSWKEGKIWMVDLVKV